MPPTSGTIFDPTSQIPISTIPVISWEDAMQQVGDDEEFLRELLNDLRTEIDTQLSNIAAIIQVSCWFMDLHSLLRFAPSLLWLRERAR